MTNPSLCIYFSRLSLDGLCFFLRAKLSFGGDWCILFFCPTWYECWRRWCICAGWRHLPSASAAGLPGRISADAAVLAWAVAPRALSVLGLPRHLCNPCLITVQYWPSWSLSFVPCFSDVNDLKAIWPCSEILLLKQYFFFHLCRQWCNLYACARASSLPQWKVFVYLVI